MQYKDCPSKYEVHHLFNSVMSITCNHGIERSRFGGAMSIFNSDPSLMLDLLSKGSLAPRKWIGTIIVESGMTFDVVYISATGEAKKWKYSVPKRGGQLKMHHITPQFLSQFESILLPFVECKIWTAHLLHDISHLVNMVPRAVATEFSNIEKAMILSERVFDRNNVVVADHPKEFQFEVIFQYSLFLIDGASTVIRRSSTKITFNRTKVLSQGWKTKSV
mmetsp:Transcript_4439/g.9623  ORF Transcript_4439/g.9623 Transcript_4439/m.9623 type:complete len:220 (-) Transcript_4439:90-749(-)